MYSHDRSDKGFFKAFATTRNADMIFLKAILSGETHSLADINLKGVQSKLMSALKETSKPLIIPLRVGRPLSVELILHQTDTFPDSLHLGTMGGTTLIDDNRKQQPREFAVKLEIVEKNKR